MAIKIPKFNQSTAEKTTIDTTPYTAPRSEIDWVDYGAYNDSKFYSLNGRIGRIQYLAYPMVCYFVIFLIVFFLFFSFGGLASVFAGDISGQMSGTLLTMLILIMPVMVYVTFSMTIRRLNDVNKTGWLSLLLFVPVAQTLLHLYLLFARGDEGVNDYGLPPKPPSRALVFIGVGLPILFLIFAIILPIVVDSSNVVSTEAPVVSAQPTNSKPVPASEAPSPPVISTPTPETVTSTEPANITASQSIESPEVKTEPEPIAEPVIDSEPIASIDSNPEKIATISNHHIQQPMAVEPETIPMNTPNTSQSQGAISYEEYIKLSESTVYSDYGR